MSEVEGGGNSDQKIPFLAEAGFSCKASLSAQRDHEQAEFHPRARLLPRMLEKPAPPQARPRKLGFWCFLGSDCRGKSRGFVGLLVQMDDLWVAQRQQHPTKSWEFLPAPLSSFISKAAFQDLWASVLYMVTKKKLYFNKFFFFKKMPWRLTQIVFLTLQFSILPSGIILELDEKITFPDRKHTLKIDF